MIKALWDLTALNPKQKAGSPQEEAESRNYALSSETALLLCFLLLALFSSH